MRRRARPVVVLADRLRHLDGHVAIFLPGRLLRRRLDACLVEDRLVVEHREGIEAEPDAPQLAVDRRQLQQVVAEIGHLQRVGHELVERQAGAALRVVGDRARLQLKDVRDVAPGHFGRELRPVPVSAYRLADHRHARMRLVKQLGDGDRPPGAVVRPPPHGAKPSLIFRKSRNRTRCTECQAGGNTGRAHQQRATIDAHDKSSLSGEAAVTAMTADSGTTTATAAT